MHWENSTAHNLCSACGFDGDNRDELEDHFRMKGCFPYCCYGCDTWFQTHSSYAAHQDEVVACHRCDKHCFTDNSLTQHLITHEDAKMECWGCDRKFTRMSHLILHLESGTCLSGCGLHDIDFELMGKCGNLHSFIDNDYFSDFRNGVDIQQVYGRAFPFQCGACKITYRLLSALCQHLENSVICDKSIADVSFRSLRTQFERKFL